MKKLEKDVSNLYDKTEYIIHIRNLKHALNHRIILKQLYAVIKFNQEAWLKPYIDMNTKQHNMAKNKKYSWEIFLQANE